MMRAVERIAVGRARRIGTRVPAIVTALLALAAATCLSASSTVSALAAEPLVIPGSGSFVLDPPQGPPVRVWYVAPRDPATAEVLVVVHGMSRDGRAHRDDWARLVAGRDVLVLVPELHVSGYPDYNVGHVLDARGRPVPRREWTLGLVETLFDRVVAATGSTERDYALFGFSGGAQFVHRFVELMPGHRARVAVAANAGWYTMPDDAVPYPYGLAGSPVQTSGLADALGTNLVVLLGQRDTDPRDPSLLRNPLADRQGVQRLQRGRAFFAAASRTARVQALRFGWRAVEVPGLGHSHAGAAAAALPHLFP